MTFPNETQRREILAKVLALIDTKLVGADPDVSTLRSEHEQSVIRSSTTEELEQAVNNLLKAIGVSHTGFFHESRPRAAGRVAIAATLTKADTTDGTRWLFQDVHPGGAAALAGIRPGDVLLTIGGKEYRPPEATPFLLGQAYDFAVRRADGATVRATLTVPDSKEKKRPVVVPDQVVTASKLDDGVGYVKVSMFPGMLGMDVARDMTRAIAELNCSRLVIDLRGNTGGGIGCLRLMSHLCADRRGVGFSIGKAIARKGYRKENLRVFDRIPASKWGVVPLAIKFATSSRSLAVFTEGLGQRQHHGHVAMLVNEHSASAAEMVAAFASEYGLATLVGVRTPGRLVGANAFKVGYGYRIAIPVATYYTWQGTNLEGKGVAPQIEEPFSPEALWQGRDSQLDRALEILR